MSATTGSEPQSRTRNGADPVDGATQRLRDIFERADSKEAAHTEAEPLLVELAGDDAFITEVLRRHIRAPGSLDKRHYPVIATELESNPDFDLVVHSWLTHPEGRTDLSTKSIHHHGELLLSTVTLLGPGYEHWMFARPEELDRERSLFSMELLQHGIHEHGEYAFVDAYVAHLPLFPESLTITICLWSTRSETTWKDKLKRVPVLKKNSAKLRRLVTRFGLGDALEVKNVSYFDYHPSADGFIGLADRDEFPLGPNEDYLHSLFHVIQATGNAELTKEIEAQRGGAANRELVDQLLGRLSSGEPIESRLSPGHYDIPEANFVRGDIERALEGQAAARRDDAG